MRSYARECVYKYLFSKLFNDNEGLFDVLTKDLSNDDKSFATKLLNYVTQNEEKYLESICKLAQGYRLERVFNADKCALLIGMAELDNFTETPTPVIIDEAVKLVSIFSTEKSTDFVNGILAQYSKDR